MERPRDLLVPYRLRAVRIGVFTTFLIVAALAVYRLLPGHATLNVGLFQIAIAAAALGGVCVASAPWQRMFSNGYGMTAMYAWSAADIGLITMLAAASGGATSQMVLLYAFTTVFFSMLYPAPARAALLALTCGCYLALAAFMHPRAGLATVALTLAVFAALSAFSTFLAREMTEQMEGERSDRAESEKRSSLLATVAAAARSMTTLDHDAMFGVIVASAQSLGFEAASICLVDNASQTYRVTHARGLPDQYVNSTSPSTSGLTGLVLADQGTVRVRDYSSVPDAMPMLRAMGIRSAVGMPVWSRGEIAGVFSAGTRAGREITDQEVEALELLAAQAGRALDNARMFEEERAAVERLAELDRMKDDFVSTVSHELRTPLTAIEGIGLTLEHRWDQLSDIERRQLLERVNKNSKALDNVISTLLDFSRLDAGHQEVNLATTRLDEVLRGVAARVAPLLADHTFSADIDDMLTVRADAVMIERIVENLLSNAAKHTPAGTRVRLAAHVHASSIEIVVSDDGPGISEADLRHLGERFYRSADTLARHTRGTGLGLALVRQFLGLHGSELLVTSERGRGARFSFMLPASVPHARAV